MIVGEHTMGVFSSMTVMAGTAALSNAVMMVVVESYSAREEEYLSRSDVERLRDLCDEALS